MKASVFASTHIGLVRESNEDFYLLEPSLNLYLVCDGMGGHAAGEVASSRAGVFVLKYLKTHQADIDHCVEAGDCACLEQLLVRAVKYACLEVNNLSKQDLLLAGMGTTLTLVMLIDDRAVMAHVGDSQLYHFHGNHVFLRSHDHTLASELLASGTFSDVGWVKNFQHVLTRSIGPTPDVDVETCIFELNVGDTLLLCTDGLTRSIGCTEELQAFREHPVNQDTAEEMINYANAHGGNDNATVLLIQMIEFDSLSDQHIESADLVA